jgi:hypothetical protein
MVNQKAESSIPKETLGANVDRWETTETANCGEYTRDVV